MIPRRPDDKFGVSVLHARFSDSVRAFDRDTAAFTGMPTVIRDYETGIELNYLAQIVPGWNVQPLVQFIQHPNGDASRNAVVSGVRSMWRF